MCYCVQMTLSLWCWVPPPSHPIIHNIIKKKTSSVIAMLRCLLKVEVWIQILIQCVWTSYTQSQNIAHFATFPFWPFPKFTPLAHALFKKSYQVCYGLIGNYPSFKMIPNTTYTVLILKKYNQSESSLFTLCAGNMFRWRWCVYKKKEKKKHVLFMPILCAPMKLRLCRWQNTW